jgi:exodeoxyribonuclease VII small subunit
VTHEPAEREEQPTPGADATTTFEHARAELEEIVGRLEAGEVELEQALALWERGEVLLRLCSDRLAAVEGRVEELSARAAQPAGDGADGAG